MGNQHLESFTGPLKDRAWNIVVSHVDCNSNCSQRSFLGGQAQTELCKDSSSRGCSSSSLAGPRPLDGSLHISRMYLGRLDFKIVIQISPHPLVRLGHSSYQKWGILIYFSYMKWKRSWGQACQFLVGESKDYIMMFSTGFSKKRWACTSLTLHISRSLYQLQLEVQWDLSW